MTSIIRKDLEGDYKLLLSWRYNQVEFLGLPSLKENRPLTLEEIYVPLSFTWKLGDEERFYLPKALETSRHLVVLGDPGCGKSTLVKVITYSFGRSAPTPLSSRFGSLVPVPIILRDYNVRNWQSKEDMLTDFISQLDEEVRGQVTVEWLLAALREGRGFLLLDGLDEVGSRQNRLHLRDDIVRPLLAKMTESYAILTSRIVGYDEVPFQIAAGLNIVGSEDLSIYVDLLRCYVAPFNDEDIEQLINRWYAAREPDTERRRIGVDSLRQALHQSDRIKRLAANPSLLTLMALIHRVTAHLPSGRVKLYDKIVEAYLETIDRYRKLGRFPASLDQMKRWLARVGWEMQSRRDAEQKNELLVSQSDVLTWLKEAIEAEGRKGADEEAGEFLDYVARRSGLLIPRGPDQFAFVHLTLQEYFAAFHLRGKAILFDELAEDCAQRVALPHWHETMCVLFEMLTEFPSAGDRLIDEIIKRAKKDDAMRRGAAELFSALLPDEENGLSPRKCQDAAAFALSAACDSYDQGVIENLKQLPPERFDDWVSRWFDQQLTERRPREMGRDFFAVGYELIEDWPERLGGWIVRQNDEKSDERQTLTIAVAGAGNIEICDWAALRLPVKTWVRPLVSYIARFTLEKATPTGRLSLADVYRKALYALSGASRRNSLLAQLSSALASVKSQFLRASLNNAQNAQIFIAYWRQSLTHASDRSRASALDRDQALGLGHVWHGALDRASAQDQAYAMADFFLTGSSFVLEEALTRHMVRALVRALVRESVEDISLSQSEDQGNSKRATEIFAAAEQIFFAPDASIEPITSELQKMISAEDDWTRLLALSALLMIGEGSPELCKERNSLLKKGIRQSRKFTFPEELHPETETQEFREQLPEILDLIFLHDPDDPWLKPELFDPSRPESKYFLSDRREFFALAAESLDPAGETELAKWRRPE